jgi:hypothetical protein
MPRARDRVGRRFSAAANRERIATMTKQADALNAILAEMQAMREEMARMKAETEAAKAAATQSQGKAKDDIRTKIVKAFERAGYKNVVLFDPSKPLSAQPDVTCLTWNKWMLDLGRMVRKGERSIKITGYPVRLFHVSQTEVATPEQRKAAFQKRQEAAAKREAKAQPAA